MPPGSPAPARPRWGVALWLGLLGLQAALGWAGARARAGGCPPPCECSEAARTVQCAGRGLREVPRDLPPSTRSLSLTGNPLGSLPATAFPALPELRDLRLSSCELRAVEADALAPLPSLWQLDLRSNPLDFVSPRAFGNASSALRELSLAGALANLSAVAALLQGGALPSLAHLDLADNGLLSLPEGIFSALPSLQHLDLRNNSLVSLHNVSFQGLGQLESLNLSDNSLMRLRNATLSQLRSLPRLQRIGLSHNPWVCDCNIEDMVNWLKESNQVEGKGSLSCSYPDGLLDKPLVKIRSSDLNCSLPVDIQSQLQTSYVFLGIVLALIGAIFLLVLYLNRKGIKKWMHNIRDACRDHMEGYHYRYEINADPRLTNLSSNSDV